MPYTPQKIPFQIGLGGAIVSVSEELRALLGKSLPASVVEVVGGNNTIVKVKFEVLSHWTLPEITVPVFGPEYVRWPIQKGDKGLTFSCDVYLGGMSGLGGGVADFTPRGNLSTMVWMPIGNTGFEDTENPDAIQLYGPDGAILKTLDPNGGKVRVNKGGVETSLDNGQIRTELDEEGFKVFINGQLKFIVNAQGAKFLSPSGFFGIEVTDGGTLIDGINFLPHTHGGVQTGSSSTAAVDTP